MKIDDLTARLNKSFWDDKKKIKQRNVSVTIKHNGIKKEIMFCDYRFENMPFDKIIENVGRKLLYRE